MHGVGCTILSALTYLTYPTFLIMNTPRIISLCSALAFLVSCGQEDNTAAATETAPQPAQPQASPTPPTTEAPTPQTAPEAQPPAPADTIAPGATEEETTQAPNGTDVRTRGMKVKKSATTPAIEQDEEVEAEPDQPATERYNNGEGAPADTKQAIKWYKEFADAGIADAQYKLAECYYNTRSEPFNFVKAVEQYRAAAEQGHTDACRKLAQCYQMGIGTEASEEEAQKWRSAAGDTPAEPNETESTDDM